MPRRKRKRAAAATAKPRASWRGMLRFGLVAFPAEAFNAHLMEKDHVQLRAECHSRIRYQKVCPIHGPVDSDEIVSGYEISRGRYVEIDENELDKAATDQERSLTIDAFVQADEVDPFYFDGRVYFLSPEGETAKEP
ncbi:MAG: Ku protein [Planctomycetaceae bacterium]